MATRGYETIVQLLIGRDDVDINIKNEGGQTPFLVTAKKGQEALVQLLIEKDINNKDNDE